MFVDDFDMLGTRIAGKQMGKQMGISEHMPSCPTISWRPAFVDVNVVPIFGGLQFDQGLRYCHSAVIVGQAAMCPCRGAGFTEVSSWTLASSCGLTRSVPLPIMQWAEDKLKLCSLKPLTDRMVLMECF